ncbi:hypothetical protein B0H14DRAFT_2634364 [Mycena olivaceomarginata]|nr:hypothetical protein B0H14DRAFT_2634364 [Mycena olivaceomarginata]
MATLPLPGEPRDSDFDNQILPPTFHNLFRNQQNSQMDQEDTAMDIDPPQFAPILHQMLLPGAGPAASGSSKKSADRCAVCTFSYCVKRRECPGNGNRKYCRCNHPPAPTKVHITEAQIIAYLEQQRNCV